MSVLREMFAGASARKKASNGTVKIEQAPAAQRRRALKARGLKKAEGAVDFFCIGCGGIRCPFVADMPDTRQSFSCFFGFSAKDLKQKITPNVFRERAKETKILFRR